MLTYSLNGNLSGQVCCPISKSELHRLILACSLSQGCSIIKGCTLSDDIRATASVMKTLGAKITFEENAIYIQGISQENISKEILQCPCGESGSTLRFLVPLCGALSRPSCFTGQGRLAQRPMKPLLEQLRLHGLSLSHPENGDTLPLTLSGNLKAGTYHFPGNVSSQYITGLLFALPLLSGNSQILLTSPLESLSYVNMTLDVLKRFGISIHAIENGWEIPGNQQYRSPGTLTANGDWSAAAFWLCAGALSKSGSITITGIDPHSLQGDCAVCSVLEQMGAKLISQENSVTVFPGNLHGITIDGSQIPDIIPILSVAAAFAQGETRIKNAGRLRIKESDRLHAMYENLTSLGADVQELPDGFIIHGKKQLEGGSVSSYNDHRIAMSMAVASLRCRQPVLLRSPLCVAKSYPEFYQDFKKLGGNIHVIHLGE